MGNLQIYLSGPDTRADYSGEGLFHMNKAICFCLGLLFAGVAAAQPQTFTFSQAGFAEGATVVGSFTGEDLDTDGQLASFAGEISDFQMSFSGNSVVPAFSLGFADLSGLVYDLDGGPLGDGQILGIEGIAANDATFSYAAGPGPVALCGEGVDCATVSNGTGTDNSQELIQVGGSSPPTAVPTLGAYGLVFTVLGLLLVAVRRLSRK